MQPADLRAEIPALSDVAYLNYGAHGPSPRRVTDAAQEFLADHERETAVDGDPYGDAFAVYERVRERVAAFLGADPTEVALTESTGAGIASVAAAMDWDPGDVVVRTDLEHPAGMVPWARLERQGVEVRVLETEAGRLDHEAYADAVADAKLVCFSAVTWTHGTRLPVRELVEVAHDAGAFVLVDAVQVPGTRPLEVGEWGADAVAAAGQKWLLGPWGTGLLYVDGAAAEHLEPAVVGYRGAETTDEGFAYEPGAARFEVGSASPAPYVGLSEALDALEAVGLARVEERSRERLTDRLKEGLGDRLLSPREYESGLVTFAADDPEATVERLAERGVMVRSLPHPDAVRASVHAVSSEADVDRLLDGLAEEWA